MIRDAVILAAGLGSRLRQNGTDVPKPLFEVSGQTMICRTILTLASAGIKKVVIVVGFMADAIRCAVETDAAIQSSRVEIVFVTNAEYKLSNGVSVLVAASVLSGPFLLSMSDHVYEPEVAARLIGADMNEADLYLAVDRRLDEIYDMDDATKVRAQDDHIVEIHKQLVDFNCVDCGVFAVSQALCAALATVKAARGDCSLSEGVLELAKRRRAKVVDIGTAFWQDVDTPGALVRAEQELARLAGK